VIDPTDEMVTVAAEVAEDEMIRRLGRDLGTIHRDDIIRAVLAAALAIVERNQTQPARVLMDAAATARGIADRLGSKPGNGKVWPAMSAGARLVAVRLVELADDADGNGHAPIQPSPRYVIVEHHHGRRERDPQIYDVHTTSDLSEAQERAAERQANAVRCGRPEDIYRVAELQYVDTARYQSGGAADE
jgi:hypothetical protein